MSISMIAGPTLRLWLAPASLLLLAACAEQAPAPAPAPAAPPEASAGEADDLAGIDPAAAELIAAGDMANDEAEARRARVAEIDQELATAGGGGLDWAGSATRSAPTTTPALSDADRAALIAERAVAEAEADRLRQEAEENWQRAAAIDASAMEAILQRMRGEQPGS